MGALRGRVFLFFAPERRVRKLGEIRGQTKPSLGLHYGPGSKEDVSALRHVVRDSNRNYTSQTAKAANYQENAPFVPRVSWADPEIVEQWKWRGAPVWSHGGRLEFQRRKTGVDSYTPISSFHSVGFRAMNSFIRPQGGTPLPSTSTPTRENRACWGPQRLRQRGWGFLSS